MSERYAVGIESQSNYTAGPRQVAHQKLAMVTRNITSDKDEGGEDNKLIWDTELAALLGCLVRDGSAESKRCQT